MRFINIEELLLILFLFTGFLFHGCENSEIGRLDNACAESNLESCYKLGMHYEKEAIRDKAKSYYLLACSKSVSQACYKLGVFSNDQGNSSKGKKFFHLMNIYRFLILKIFKN